MKCRLPISGAILALTLVSYFQFPGHTYLQSDTQIYAPILEHFWDNRVLQREMLVQHPHVSFTLYDETALALRRFAGLSFEHGLTLVQLVTRALGIFGFYLLATALGLPMWQALFVTAALSLGATIGGPSVLIFEYEPVPRGFAIPLVYAAAGLAAHNRHALAGLAASAALLFHPPSVYPFWAVYFLLLLWPAKPDVMRRRLYALVPLLGAVVVLLAASRMQEGPAEAQRFLATLDPLQEKLQRLRASYVWVSVWGPNWAAHYILLWLISLLALWRQRATVSHELRLFLLGLPAIGLLSMPVSLLLLERWKWAFIPQFQPLRAVLFITVVAALLAAVAGVKAAARGGYFEGIAWFLLAYLIPVQARLTQTPPARRLLVALALASLAVLAVLVQARFKRNGALAAAALAAFFVFPGIGQVRNYPSLETPALQQLSLWARDATRADAMFLFPKSDRSLDPGIFRARSLRAVYVDWKGGGQVNYIRELGEEWWARWGQSMETPLEPQQYAGLGIDYLVTPRDKPLDGASQVYGNDVYLVYRVTPAARPE
ncbi:MAG: DUF6798 domain-containing protein [Bryobacteraceae bacterium]